MKEFKYDYTPYRFLIIPVMMIVMLFCYLFVKNILSREWEILIYPMLAIAMFSLYILKMLVNILYHMIMDAPHTIVIKDDSLIVQKLFVRDCYKIKDFHSIVSSSYFIDDNVYNVIITLRNKHKKIRLMDYAINLSDLVNDILEKNHDCIVDNILLSNNHKKDTNRLYRYIYPWYHNVQLIVATALVWTSFTIFTLAGYIASLNIISLAIFALLLYTNYRLIKHLLLFFINKPYQIDTMDDKINICLGLKTTKEIFYHDIVKINYKTGFYNMVCIYTLKGNYYFDLSLIGYKTMIEMLKHKNPNIEIDHKSIFAAEEKERKNKR